MGVGKIKKKSRNRTSEPYAGWNLQSRLAENIFPMLRHCQLILAILMRWKVLSLSL